MALVYNPIAPGLSFSARAGAAIDKYNAVIIGASEGYVIESASTNARGIGFMHTGEALAAEDHVTVFTSGVVWARCVTTCTYGDEMETAADGEIQTAGVGDFVVGIALGASTAADELIPLLITFYEKAAS